MADLSRREAPIKQRRQGSDNRDSTLPSRRNTDAPNLEVNARITGKNDSEAQRLREILNVGAAAAEAGLGFIDADRQNRNAEQSAAGALAGAQGVADPAQIARSRAYADAFYTSGARRASIDLSTRIAQRVNDRLTNEDDPATLEDIDQLLNDEFAAIGLDERGLPRDFGSPGAATTLATSMAQIRATVLPQAAEAIRTRTNTQLIDNIAAVAVAEGVPLLGDRTRLPAAADVRTIDPNSALTPPAATPASTPAARPAAPAPAAATSANLIPRMVQITAQTESGNRDRTASGAYVTSPKGAQGRMQVMPGTQTDPGFGVRPAQNNGPEELARVGREYLAAMMSRYGNDPARAWAAYNWGPGNLDRAVSLYGNDWLQHAPRETRDYVATNIAALGGQVEGGSTGTPVEVVDVQAPPRPTVIAPAAYDFEALMDRVPATVPRGEAKEQLIQALIVHAETNQNPGLLLGLTLSTRADGTPSFNPREIATLRDAARTLDARGREEARRIQNDRYEATADRFLGEFVEGRQPSLESIRREVRAGNLSEEFAYTLINSIESDQRQEAAMARQEEREARSLEAQELAVSIAAEAEARALGDLTGASVEADNRRLRSGELGTGRTGAANYRQLRNAARRGAAAREEQPDGALYVTRIRTEFAPRRQAGDGSLLLQQQGQGYSAEVQAAAISRYRQLLSNGEPPAVAYATVQREYARRPTSGPNPRLLELRGNQ